ncbi:hypothetical protein [Pseudarthrobacter sp. MEB009]|uniref:LolA family protein n=1 Tax=Pseudarthrobacter sp. MEB009 TaxID=3040326 RepID=UPI002556E369|nr:hypothetical protein [Pseudarthrobacter sp. MEB009]
MWTRWLPSVAVPAVIAAGVLVGTLPAGAADPLPARTPAQVIELMGTRTAVSFTGTLEQATDFGLPDLPAAGPSSGPAAAGDGPAGSVASIAGLLAADHTARVYADGPAKLRVQVADGSFAERNMVRRGTDVWFYASKDNSAAHLVLQAPDRGSGDPSTATPADIAGRFLAAADPDTEISVGAEVEVAGRAAYNLLLEPRTADTLVGRIAIAVDGETGLPLSVQVTARGAATPAFRSGFTALALGAPDDSLFTFVPPAGSSVREIVPPAPGLSHDVGDSETPPSGPRPAVTGSGWTSVLAVPAPAAGGTGAGANALLADPLLSQAAVDVPGGKLLSTPLFTVLVMADGRLLAGLVPGERLQAAAAAAQ